MARKVRRVRKPKKGGGESGGGNATKSTPSGKVTEEDFRREYAYVLKDLRRMAVLATIMFILLIVINLVFQAM